VHNNMSSQEIDNLFGPSSDTEECQCHRIKDPKIQDIPELSPGTTLKTNAEYANTLTPLYKVCEVKQDQNNGNTYLRINFLEPQKDIVPFKSFDKGQTRLTMLYQILFALTNYSVTEPLVRTILPSLNVDQVNNCLLNKYKVKDEDDVHTLFIKFITQALKWLIILQEKSMFGLKLYYHTLHINQDMKTMDNLYTMVMASGSGRNNAMEYARHIGILKQQASKLFTQYCTIGIQEKVIFNTFIPTRTHDVFSYESFVVWITTNSLYQNILLCPNPSPHNTKLFMDWVTQMKPFVELRNIPPTPYEIAHKKTQAIKPVVNSLLLRIKNYLEDEDHQNYSHGDVLVTQLDSINNILMQVLLDGIQIDKASSGTSIDELSSLRKQLKSILYDLKEKQRKEELTDKKDKTMEVFGENVPYLQLSKLSSPMDWLDWKRSTVEILGQYSLDVTKKACILESLNQMDNEACQSLSYHEIMIYLNKKYDSIVLVDTLLEDLLQLKKSRNDAETYKNMAIFYKTYNLLVYHKCTDKMDSHFRRKITFILLSRVHYVHTVRKMMEYDDQLLEESSPQQDIIDEAASAFSNKSSATKDAEIEEKTRNFWLLLMEKNYNLTRNLTIMKQQGIKEKEMKNNFSKPSNQNSYQDDYDEITDDENENNDNLDHKIAVY